MKFDVNGVIVTPNEITLTQLSAVRRAIQAAEKLGGRLHEPFKTFVQNIVPPDQYRALCSRAPAAFEGIGWQVLTELGFGASITILDEGELVGDQVEAYVAQEKRSKELYPDEDDPRRRLFPLVIETKTSGAGLEIPLIARPAMEREVDAFRKANSLEAAKALSEKVCVWGSLGGLETRAPGVYVSLAEFMLDQAGDWSAKLLGE